MPTKRNYGGEQQNYIPKGNEALMEKAIQRGSPITIEEVREMLKDSEPFDLVKEGEVLDKNIKKGLK